MLLRKLDVKNTALSLGRAIFHFVWILFNALYDLARFHTLCCQVELSDIQYSLKRYKFYLV